MGLGRLKVFCSDQGPLREAEELNWTSSYETWTNAIDK